MGFIDGLQGAWVNLQVPGTRPNLRATYAAYPDAAGVQVPDGVGDLNWLHAAPAHPESSMAVPFEGAACDISCPAASSLLGQLRSVPVDLTSFLRDGLRDRLRSATDSYFDLGNHAVPFEGGVLLHLVSDSQWTCHWSLFVGNNGAGDDSAQSPGALR